jgi:hypothetical protein
MMAYNKSLELSAKVVILEVVTLSRQEQVLGFWVGAATQLYVMHTVVDILSKTSRYSWPMCAR